MAKKTKVAATSIKAYHEIKAEGQLSAEQELVIKLMEKSKKPINSRQLMYLAKKERTNITRVIYDLEKLNKVSISHKAKCPITGRTVRYYSLVNNQSLSA